MLSLQQVVATWGLASCTPPLVNPRLSASLHLISLSFSLKRRAGRATRARWNPDANIEFTRDVFALFGIRSRKKKRRSWWSKLFLDFDAHDEDYDDDFGLLEEPSVIHSIFKIFQAFRWIVPTIMISMLQESDEHRLLMALAVPLGQTAVYLVVDSIWRRSGYSLNSKQRSKWRPYSRNVSKRKVKYEAQGKEDEGANGRKNYQSWTGACGRVSEGDGQSGNRFGGWDELDQ